MLKSAWHLTGTIAVTASLIGCGNAQAKDPGPEHASNLPTVRYAQNKPTTSGQTPENKTDQPADQNQATNGNVASLLNTLSQLQRLHQSESRRVAEIAAKRKAEEKPLLDAWRNFKRRAEEVRRILATASDEMRAKLSAKSEATLKAEKARIFGAWAYHRRKVDLESLNAAEAAAKRKIQIARLLAKLTQAKSKSASDRETIAKARAKISAQKPSLSSIEKAARQPAVQQNTGLRQVPNFRANQPTGGTASTVATPTPAAPSPQQAEQSRRSLARGRQFIKLGRINEGRLFLERAADAGSAEGAFELAESYDPTALKELGVVGVVSDKTLAAKWYRRAGELGANGTTERTNRLSAR